jgi:hypothetical protein
MAAASIKSFLHQAMGTTGGPVGATLYTVPTATQAAFTNIVLTNTVSQAASATVSLKGVVLLPAVTIPGNSVISFDLRQVLDAGEVLAGFASATTVNIHVSGVVIA